MNTWVPLAAVAIVLASNAAVFVHLVRDRSGEPLQTIELTEWEAPLASLPRDKSETALRLEWGHRAVGTTPDPQAHRIGRDKLQQLGFECPLPGSSPIDRSRPLPRLLFVAFRYLETAPQADVESAGGPATAEPFQTSLDSHGAGGAAAPPAANRSRLEVVDVDSDFAALRRRYPDAPRFPIFRGLVRARLEKRWNPATGQWDVEEWQGRVTSILPELVNVALPHSRVFADLPTSQGRQPRYKVTLQYGPNLEPRVTSVTVLKTP